VQAVKRIVFETVSPKDVAEVVRKIAAEAKSGKPWACKLFCDLLLGKPDHKFDPRTAAPEEGGRTPEQATLRDQLIYLRGAADAVEAQLRAQEESENGDEHE